MEDPTPSEIYDMLKKRDTYENFYFMEHKMPPPIKIAPLTDEQKEIYRKASELINEYAKKYRHSY